MPPRLITGAILGFWLSMTGWLIYREVVPMMMAEVSPTYKIDLTDEIGSPMVEWAIFLNTKHVGNGTTQIILNDDRTYDFEAAIRFVESFRIGPTHIRKMESKYRVTEDGKLVSIVGKIFVNPSEPKQLIFMPDLVLGIHGEVVGDDLESRFFMDTFEHKLDKIHLPQQGNIINPMHPISRLRGLRVGQTWTISLLDPLRNAKGPLVGDFAAQGTAIPSLIAEVKSGTLYWNHKDVPCHKIEYYEPGKDSEITARTWARKIDGLVLQQEATHFGFHLVSQRVPD